MRHEVIEKNIGLMVILTLLAISFGGLVESVPLFYQASTTKPEKNLRPLTALELEGRDIYIREGCHVCHTQMIRPLSGETERYGTFSRAGESVYEHPFLWGSKRTGPDLARVGSRYSNEWHRIHLNNPRDVVPESIMPAYPWLENTIIASNGTSKKMSAMKTLGVPYTDQEIFEAASNVENKTELDAVVAYLQQLGHSFQITDRM